MESSPIENNKTEVKINKLLHFIKLGSAGLLIIILNGVIIHYYIFATYVFGFERLTGVILAGLVVLLCAINAILIKLTKIIFDIMSR